jgi:hypothetical protein
MIRADRDRQIGGNTAKNSALLSRCPSSKKDIHNMIPESYWLGVLVAG